MGAVVAPSFSPPQFPGMRERLRRRNYEEEEREGKKKKEERTKEAHVCPGPT